jgi:hypothetical protein
LGAREDHRSSPGESPDTGTGKAQRHHRLGQCLAIRTRGPPHRPLLAIIINEITKSIDTRKSVSENEDDALAKTFGDLKRALRSIAYGFSAKAGATIPGFANLEIGFVAKDMIDRDEKLSSDRDPLLDQSLYYHAYERLEKFREQLAKSEAVDQPKIIVFIDDLDRCLPSKALHLLESLKLVLSQPGFIFVFGVDRHVIDSFLSKRYHDDFGIHADMGHGKQYMDKIIQLPLDLPNHQNRFDKYIGNLVQGTPSLPTAFSELFSNQEAGSIFVSALAAGCDRTPRTLIRTLNYLLTDFFLRKNEFFIVAKDPFGENHGEFLQFAAVSRITRITFGSDLERLYRQLVDLDHVCEQLARYFSKKPSIWGASTRDPEWGYDYPGGEEDLNESRAFHEKFRSAILKSDSLDELFHTDIGMQWLNCHEKRKAIEGFLATREDLAQVPAQTSEQIINAAIRKNLGLKEGVVTDKDRERITHLDLGGTQVGDISTLRDLTCLQWLDLRQTKVRDISALGSLIHLQWLNLSSPMVCDLAALSELTFIQELYLRGTRVDNLAPIEKLAEIKILDLGYSRVSDISTLKSFARLQSLDLCNTQVGDFSPLYSLNKSLIGLRISKVPLAQDENIMNALRAALPTTTIVGGVAGKM